MASFQFKGLEDYALKLSRLDTNRREVAGAAIYAAAGIVADEIKEELRQIPVITSQRGSRDNMVNGITKDQKQGLVDGFGITSMSEKDGFYNVKLGFDGYNAVKTEKYPKGQPNAMIARSVESGTSFRKKHPFVRPSVNRTKNAAVEAMQRVIDEKTEEIMT